MYVQADQPFRMNTRDLRQYYVRSDTNGLVPLGNIVTLQETSGPQVINHYNLFRSAEIDGAAALRIQLEPRPDGHGRSWRSRTCCKACPSAGPVWRWKKSKPAAKRSSSSASGSLWCISRFPRSTKASRCHSSSCWRFRWRCWARFCLFPLRGLVDDVYVQIGLVLLIGLSAKNSILIVEFAEQLIERGRSIVNAAIEAAELRLRPILMTSFAFILGVLPLYFATGAGKLGRHSVGTAIVGGMLFSTILNLFFIPVLYVILKSVLVSFSSKKRTATNAVVEVS